MVLYDLLYTLKNHQKCAEKFDLGQCETTALIYAEDFLMHPISIKVTLSTITTQRIFSNTL